MGHGPRGGADMINELIRIIYKLDEENLYLLYVTALEMLRLQ